MNVVVNGIGVVASVDTSATGMFISDRVVAELGLQVQ